LSDRGVKSLEIHLEGFTLEELGDIIAYISSVEANRPTRVIYAKLDAPELDVEELKHLLKEIWPEGRPITLSIFEKKLGRYRKVE